MLKSRMILTALISGALLVGCKKEEPKSTSTPPAAPAKPGAPTAPTVNGATPSVPTPPPAVTVTPPPAPTLSSPSTLDAPATPKPPVTATTSTTPDKPAATGDAQADAKATLSQFQSHMLAKNWDAAGADLKKLKGMKSQLPPQLKQAIDKRGTSFTAAKTADSLKIPGFGTPASAPANSDSNK